VRDILHISDVHFGPFFVPEAAAAVLALIEERRPDLVIVSGDLTQRARQEQFRDARAFLARIALPTLCVPGNHDVPMYRVFERVFTPYAAYRRHFAEEMEPCFEDDELFVVGINTAFNWTVKDGRFTLAALRRAEQRFAAAPAGKARLVVAHHHLVPPPRFATQRVSSNAFEALRLFAHCGVEMVFSGHLHQTWIGNSEEYYPGGGSPVRLLHSGTTCSTRGRGSERKKQTCNWVKVGPDVLQIGHLLFDPVAQKFLEQSRHLYPRLSANASSLGAPFAFGAGLS